ncbi:hypothetical protein F2Q69_00013037 [Brassica cretica]|uniref:Uncharacterized protein n=1 Tax=Brassica cretica TaxID=69181 RepID=A0A8S9QWH9_BRACR|nr:hypothetical protein F2Q69_00013037 [Brassica cretica]
MTHEEFAARHPHPPSHVYVKIDWQTCPVIDRQRETTIDRQPPAPIVKRTPLTYRVQMPKIDVARLNALRPLPKPSANPPETTNTHSDDAAEPIEFDKAPMGRTFRKRKGKVANHLKRTANEKEMENFKKRVFRIPLEKPFEEAYFTHRLWMFFRETRETEEDIRRMFCEAREKIKNRITLKKKTGPGKFTIPCTVKGIEFPHALESFTFVDCSQRSSEGIVRDLEESFLVNSRSSVEHANQPVVHDAYRPSSCHCGAEYETEYSALIKTHTATLIDSANQKSIEIYKEESIDSSPGDWENDYYNSTRAMHTATLHTEEYDEDYEEERAIEQEANEHRPTLPTTHRSTLDSTVYEKEITQLEERSDTDSLFAQACGRGTCFYRPFNKAKLVSIDITASTSIDIHSQPPSVEREKAKLNNNYLTPDEFDIFKDPDGYARAMDGHALQVSREDIAKILQIANGAENLFIQQHNSPTHQQRVTSEFYDIACGVDDCFKPKYRQHTRPSIDIDNPTSIDRRPEFGKIAYDRDGTRRFHWEEKDEYEVYRDDYEHATDVDVHIIRVSKDDIISLPERASMEEHIYLCLQEHGRSFTQTKLVPDIYTKDDINEMFYGVCGAQEKNKGDFQMKLDDVNYPLNDSISWLTTCMEEMKKYIAIIQTQRAAEATAPASIDRKISTSIDDASHIQIR